MTDTSTRTDACKHERTHPIGCDDCPAIWCIICMKHHENPSVYECAKKLREENEVLRAKANGRSRRIIKMLKEAQDKLIASGVPKTYEFPDTRREFLPVLIDRLVAQRDEACCERDALREEVEAFRRDSESVGWNAKLLDAKLDKLAAKNTELPRATFTHEEIQSILHDDET